MPFLFSPDGVSLHYETIGTGPPLVLQTGGAGDGSMWRDAGYVDALSTVCQCILLDHRGHGRSDKPNDAAAHAMERYTDDLVALLEYLDLKRAAFWGYSQAARIGIAFAASHPDRLTALITTGVIGNPDARARREKTRRTVSAIRDRGWQAIIFPAETAQIPNWFQRQIESTDPEMLALWMEANCDWDLWARLPLVLAPVLMLVGEQEDPEDWNSRAARLMHDARVIRLAGLGHLAAYIQSELLLPYAIEFLAQVRRLAVRE